MQQSHPAPPGDAHAAFPQAMGITSLYRYGMLIAYPGSDNLWQGRGI